MSAFYYTPDMQDTVTKALGDGWRYDHDDIEWSYTSDNGVDIIKEAFDGVLVLVSTYGELDETSPVLLDAASRLRVAGLQEVAQ